MTEQFSEQGGTATMDPSPMKRWVTSRVIRKLINPGRLQQRRRKAERERVKSGAAHCVEYFHQVDDAYSQLAVQTLEPLLAQYDIQLQVHLVSGPSGDNLPEPDLLPRLSLKDAVAIAGHYGLDFPAAASLPTAEQVLWANSILAGASVEGFSAVATAIGDVLFRGGPEAAMQRLGEIHGCTDEAQTRVAITRGNERRRQLGHYAGAMFYYAGEWYWGVDRLYHLENRLLSLGANREVGASLLYPRPAIESGPAKDDGGLTLEVYASLRSPYTALIFDRAVQLARDTGVNLTLRPVLPMVMRGVSLSRQKGLYIFADAAREARELGVEFGKFYDPIGNPVRRCYSLYSWAAGKGRQVELMGSFLRAAFAQGVNTNTDKGMQHVVEQAGLDWGEAQQIIDNSEWQGELEQNRLAMYGFDCWGVPSFRLLDRQGNTLLALWGQDRLWLVSRAIQSALGEAGSS